MLDGIGNNKNRLIIAMTNNPQDINTVLLRPGRFDIKLKLSFCSYEMFVNITKSYYDNVETLLENENIKNKVIEALELNITPVNLINKMVISTSFDNYLELISNSEKEEYTKTL
jgi:chaperone BCS1